MGKSKKRRVNEEREDYWKMTAAWTDVYDIKFNKALRISLHYIDKNIDRIKQSKGTKKFAVIYKELQDDFIKAFGWKGKDPGANARKGINTFVKLGFINPYLNGYNKLSKKFVNSTDNDEKCTLFSRIFYEGASFASSVTSDMSNENHMAFLLRTLAKNKSLTKEDIKALMITNIHDFSKGYLTSEELKSQLIEAELIDFEDRKYNQISHLMAFLKTFSKLQYNKREGKIYFADDPDGIDYDIDEKFHCDPIKLRLHRQELLDESRRLYGSEICYLEKKSFKGLRDSHIKPKQLCVDEGNEDEAYDVNNGLLLSPNVDQYFDKFDISFENDGKILVGKSVDSKIKIELEKMSLDEKVLNDQRKRFLAYHRMRYFQKNGDK